MSYFSKRRVRRDFLSYIIVMWQEMSECKTVHAILPEQEVKRAETGTE